MPLHPGRQDVGQLHPPPPPPPPPPAPPTFYLLDANASLDLVLLSQSLTLQHCMMLVSININKVRTKDFAIFASNRLSAFLKHSNIVERK